MYIVLVLFLELHEDLEILLQVVLWVELDISQLFKRFNIVYSFN